MDLTKPVLLKKKKIKFRYVKVNDKYYKKYENGRRIRTTKQAYLKHKLKKKVKSKK